MFVRFVVGQEDENPYRLTGLFTECDLLDRSGELFAHESAWMRGVFDWFDRNLPVPPFRRNLRIGTWSAAAVSWFLDDAGEPLRRIWDLAAILREHGTPVRMMTSERPGKIVYRDPYQIVAEIRPRGW